MRIEQIDLLLIHRPDALMEHHETGKALDDAIASGKIRAAGVSNFRPHDWQLLQSDKQNDAPFILFRSVTRVGRPLYITTGHRTVCELVETAWRCHV